MSNKTTTSKEQGSYSFDEISTLQVSKHTAEAVKLYTDAQSLYGAIYSYVEYHYGTHQVDEVMSKDFHPKMSALMDEIANLIKESICESFGFAGNTTIL